MAESGTEEGEPEGLPERITTTVMFFATDGHAVPNAMSQTPEHRSLSVILQLAHGPRIASKNTASSLSARRNKSFGCLCYV